MYIKYIIKCWIWNFVKQQTVNLLVSNLCCWSDVKGMWKWRKFFAAAGLRFWLTGGRCAKGAQQAYFFVRQEFSLFEFCSDSEKYKCAKLGIAFLRIPKDAKEGRREKLKKQFREKSLRCWSKVREKFS